MADDPGPSEASVRSNRGVVGLRLALGGLAVLDLGLGLTALFFPETYLTGMHSAPVGPGVLASGSLLRRTGTLWLGFAAVQGVAALDPTGRPAWVLVAGAFRLLDVPADLVYFLSAGTLSGPGFYGLLLAPWFNLAVGAWFLRSGYRGLEREA